MSLFITGEMQHIAEMNALNRGYITASDIAFGPREEPTPEEIEEKKKESKRLVTGVSAKYFGQAYIFYDRLSMETAFANQLVMLKFIKPVTTLYAHLDELNDQLSTVFTQADVEDFIFPVDEETGIMTLTAKAGNPFWHESVTIGYEISDSDVINIPDVELDGVMTPNSSIVGEQASMRYSALDFKDSANFFQSLTVGDLDETARTTLATALHAMDGCTWNVNNPADYSLAGVKLAYIGEDPAWVVNRQFRYVAVFELSASSQLSRGLMYLHYTIPETP